MRRLNNALALFIITLCLIGVGLIMVYSASAALTVKNPRRSEIISFPEIPPTLVSIYHSTYFLERQALWICIALGLMFLFYTLKQELFYRLSIIFLGFSVLLLILVLVVGERIHGAARWLQLPGGISFQPSELAKVALILFTTSQLSRLRKEELWSFRRVMLVLIAPLALVAGLILLEPDFGGAVVLGLIVIALLFVGGVRVRHLVVICLIAAIAVSPFLFSSDYRRQRILAFIYPEKYGGHVNYHLQQSLIALGSGGLFGRGLGESVQKYHFLSEAHTDFIFSIIGEEMGFLGTIAVILLFTALLLVSLRIVWEAVEYRAGTMAVGMVLMIIIPAIVNIMVATKSGPAKGLPLPFISYGGSSLVANSIAIGVLMNIARCRELIPKRH